MVLASHALNQYTTNALKCNEMGVFLKICDVGFVVLLLSFHFFIFFEAIFYGFSPELIRIEEIIRLS